VKRVIANGRLFELEDLVKGTGGGSPTAIRSSR